MLYYCQLREKERGLAMLRFVGRRLETSVATFHHTDYDHRIDIFSCIHLGSPDYYRILQDTIDGWSGLIFKEELTGDGNLRKQVPQNKWGLQGMDWRLLHELQRMSSQRVILKYPSERTISPDISWEEVLGLTSFVPELLSVPEGYCARVMRALKENPDEAYVVLWYLLERCLQGLCRIPEEVSYRDEMRSLYAVFDEVARGVESIPGADEGFIQIYKVLEHEYLHEPTVSFVPERDTSVLRNVDLERAGRKRDILIVYGVGHYRGIARGLRERCYQKTEVNWNSVCEFPNLSFEDFSRSLMQIYKSTLV